MMSDCRIFLAAVPPQGARIVTPEQPMTAGRTYDISCVVWGSNPPARVEWYRGDRKDMKPIKVPTSRFLAHPLHDLNTNLSLR